jgi:hypothetical protein
MISARKNAPQAVAILSILRRALRKRRLRVCRGRAASAALLHAPNL